MTGEELERRISRLLLIKYEILLFNNNFSTAVYVLKMSAITFGIVGGFGFLSLIDKNPVLALGFGNIFIVDTITFNGTHRIPEKVEELKRDILVKSRKVLGIPGIKVGGFNYMERESTLIFLQYVLERIVDLLITFN